MKISTHFKSLWSEENMLYIQLHNISITEISVCQAMEWRLASIFIQNVIELIILYLITKIPRNRNVKALIYKYHYIIQYYLTI